MNIKIFNILNGWKSPWIKSVLRVILKLLGSEKLKRGWLQDWNYSVCPNSIKYWINSM